MATLQDENGANAESEKMLEIDFANGKPSVAGDQFGRARSGKTPVGVVSPADACYDTKFEPRQKPA